MKTANKSISFKSDRGNDVFTASSTTGDVITIRLDPASAPLINTSDSYLQYSLEMNTDGCYAIPDPDQGAFPFEEITIYDGNMTTVLETISSAALLNSLKMYYSNNVNDDQLDQIFGARCKLGNPLFVDNTAGGNYNEVPTINGAAGQPTTSWNNPTGGLESQFYKLESETAVSSNLRRKAQVLYRFPLSGLLSAAKTELLPLIVLDGLVIKIRLMAANKFLNIQYLKSYQGSGNIAANAAGIGATTARTGRIGYLGAGGNYLDANGDPNVNWGTNLPNTFDAAGPTQSDYTIVGYVDNADAFQTIAGANIPNGTQIKGFVLGSPSAANGYTAGAGYQIDRVNNFIGAVGQQMIIEYAGGAGTGTIVADAGGAVATITSITSDAPDNRIVVRFAQITTKGVNINDNAPLALDLGQNPNDGDGNAGQRFNGSYKLTDLEYVANVVEAPAGYLATMVEQAQSGALRIQYNSYQDVRVNITRNARSNEIFIPNELSRAYCILATNENLGKQLLFGRRSLQPEVLGLSSYQWIMRNGSLVPNVPIHLDRLAVGRVSPLQIIELEKALTESSFPIKNIINPSKFCVLGRRLGPYGDSMDLREFDLKCRINYSEDTNQSLLYHFYIYHTKTIMFQGGGRVVMN